MTFEEFQNRARLLVVGALEPREVREVQEAEKQFGQKAEAFVQKCYALREAFALSLRSPEASALLRNRLLAMVRKCQQR